MTGDKVGTRISEIESGSQLEVELWFFGRNSVQLLDFHL